MDHSRSLNSKGCKGPDLSRTGNDTGRRGRRLPTGVFCIYEGKRAPVKGQAKAEAKMLGDHRTLEVYS